MTSGLVSSWSKCKVCGFALTRSRPKLILAKLASMTNTPVSRWSDGMSIQYSSSQSHTIILSIRCSCERRISFVSLNLTAPTQPARDHEGNKIPSGHVDLRRKTDFERLNLSSLVQSNARRKSFCGKPQQKSASYSSPMSFNTALNASMSCSNVSWRFAY